MNLLAMLGEPNRELMARLAPVKLPPTRAAIVDRKSAAQYANPWNLRPGEERFVCALVAHGGQAEAARALGVTIKTANAYARNIKDRMQMKSTLHVVLAYDRWKRGQG